MIEKTYASFKGSSNSENIHAFISGVPARDLTRADWDALTSEQQAMCLSTKLYAVASEKPAAKKEGE